MATKTADPLSFMQKLSDTVFFYQPPDLPTISRTTSAPTIEQDREPAVVLLLGWMDARDAHLAWFAQRYRIVFPRAAIVLVKARTVGLSVASIGRRDAQAAALPLRTVLGDGTHSGMRLLIHAFSGGGSSSLYHLYNLYGSPVPKHATIFDSTPGVWSYSFASNVLVAGVKNGLIKYLLAIPLSHVLAIISWLCISALAIAPDTQKIWATAHNNPAKNLETRRTYMYSDVDKIVSKTAIETHADEAEAKGFIVWRRELFEGSGHVAHAKSDPERYWRVVKETWEGKTLA
ncbi:hypothetical protein GQ53DRAFT_809825 [Thozetella sp. PMI_491]|nr:hypothetical protein GQ53DRAFT_809825 [Thozetella sp. PMI_491]